MSGEILKFEPGHRQQLERTLVHMRSEFAQMDPLACMFATGLLVSMQELEECLQKEKEGTLTNKEWEQSKELIGVAADYHSLLQEKVGCDNLAEDARLLGQQLVTKPGLDLNSRSSKI